MTTDQLLTDVEVRSYFLHVEVVDLSRTMSSVDDDLSSILMTQSSDSSDREEDGRLTADVICGGKTNINEEGEEGN